MNIKSIFTSVIMIGIGLTGFSLNESKTLRAANPVYDAKSISGSACHVYYCNFAPFIGAQQFGHSADGLTFTLTGSDFPSPPSSSNLCEVLCPITRDRQDDPAGISVAWVDVGLNTVSPPEAGRQVTCAIVENSALTSIAGGTRTWSYEGPKTTWTPSNSQVRLALTPPAAPTQSPPPTIVPVNGFLSGAAAIHCTVPHDTTIYEIIWAEQGADTNDW